MAKRTFFSDDHTAHPVDTASLHLTMATALLRLLEPQFEGDDKTATIDHEHIHATLLMIGELVEGASDAVQQLGMVPNPKRRAA